MTAGQLTVALPWIAFGVALLAVLLLLRRPRGLRRRGSRRSARDR